MKWLKSSLIVVFSLVISVSVSKAETRKISINGQIFICFTEDSAKLLLEHDKSLDLVQKEKEKLLKKLVLKDEELSLTNSLLTSEKQISEKRMLQLNVETERRKQAENSLHAWYRSPWLWGSVGVLLGVGVVELAR